MGLGATAHSLLGTRITGDRLLLATSTKEEQAGLTGTEHLGPVRNVDHGGLRDLVDHQLGELGGVALLFALYFTDECAVDEELSTTCSI